ncbi:MAG: hypothetical protein RL235_705 [Chlamydiota bacterium]|jgi:hypothetical protein
MHSILEKNLFSEIGMPRGIEELQPRVFGAAGTNSSITSGIMLAKSFDQMLLPL